MEYQGKLYGKLGGKKYFDTGKTSEDFDTMESLHKSSSHQIRMLMDENLKLQAELKTAKADKAEAWDDGFKEGVSFENANFNYGFGVNEEPTNPYK